MIKVDHSPSIFYDRNADQVLFGRAAVDYQIETGGHPGDMVLLGAVLRNNGIEIQDNEERTDRTREYWSTASASEYIEAVKWIGGIVTASTNDNELLLNQSVLSRAHKLGLFASRDQVISPKRFGTFAELYKQAGINSSKRKGLWKRVSSAEMSSKIEQLARELGRTPTWDDMEMKSQVDTTFPRPHFYQKRFGSWPEALRAANHVSSREWKLKTKLEFVQWGEMLAEANGGLIATERIVRHFRKPKTYGELASPPVKTIVDRFNSFGEYQHEVQGSYEGKINQRNQKLAEIINDTGQFPPGLFEGSFDESELLARRAKFLVITKSGLRPEPDTLLMLCLAESQRFSAALKKYIAGIYGESSTFSRGDIESIAVALDIFDDIWTPDKKYLELLRIPSYLIPPPNWRRVALA